MSLLRTSEVTGFQYGASDVGLPGSTTLLHTNAAYTYPDVMTHVRHSENLFTCSSLTSKQTGAYKHINIFNLIRGTMIIIITIDSTALGGPWPPPANVTSDLYPGHPPANFYNAVSSCLPLPR